MTMVGHAELSKLIQAVMYWPRTYHLVGQGLYNVDGGHAVGEVYCAAHHFNSYAPDMLDDEVMYLRYQDTYIQNDRGDWLIVERVVVTDVMAHVSPALGTSRQPHRPDRKPQ